MIKMVPLMDEQYQPGMEKVHFAKCQDSICRPYVKTGPSMG